MATTRTCSARILAGLAVLAPGFAQPTFPPPPATDLRAALRDIDHDDVGIRLAAIRRADHPDLFRTPNLARALVGLVPALVHQDRRLQHAAAALLFERKGSYDELGFQHFATEVERQLSIEIADLAGAIRGTRSANPRVRALCTHLLGFHFADAARTRLAEILEHGPADLRWRAAWAFGRGWAKEPKHMRLLAAARDAASPILRAWATLAHLKTGGVTKPTHRRLERILVTGPVDLKALAVRYVGATPGIDRSALLRTLCFVGDGCVPELRHRFYRAVASLAARGAPDARVRAFLVRGLSSPDLRTRNHALVGLEKATDLRDGEIAKILAVFERKPDPADRSAEQRYYSAVWQGERILMAQERLPAPRLLKWLQTRLDGEVWESCAAMHLARKLGARALPLRGRIKQALVDAVELRHIPLATLVSIGQWSKKDHDLLPVLRDCLRSKDARERAAAAEVLPMLRGIR